MTVRQREAGIGTALLFWRDFGGDTPSCRDKLLQPREGGSA